MLASARIASAVSVSSITIAWDVEKEKEKESEVYCASNIAAIAVGSRRRVEMALPPS